VKVGDPVVLACAPWPGVVEKMHTSGRFDIALDGGGKAYGMSEDDVKAKATEVDETERERGRQTADKSWPPKTMESKVPDQTGQK
jgi:hypothetical protein